MAFTKRFSNRWQASANYLLSALRDGTPAPRTGLYEVVTFPVAADLGGEYGIAASDQRHRAVFNGIWDVGYGFQLSGVYFYGSGLVYSTNYGGDVRNYGTTQVGRLRPKGDRAAQQLRGRSNLASICAHNAFSLARAWVDGCSRSQLCKRKLRPYHHAGKQRQLRPAVQK